MKSQIDEIVKIKEFRETAAMNEVMRAEQHLQEMIRALKKRRQELDDYQKWRVIKEDKLYNKVLKKKVYVRHLEDLRQEIVDLRVKEDDYSKAVDEAIQKEEEAVIRLKDAKQEYMKAVRNTQKMQEISRTLGEEEALEEMRYEESELEEQAVSISIGPREEWDL